MGSSTVVSSVGIGRRRSGENHDVAPNRAPNPRIPPLASSHLMAYRIPIPGSLVDGKYRLADRIGGGGMGDVYKANTGDSGCAVAIKFLHPELTEDAELAQRFFQEARAVNRINHPNIVDVLDTGIGDFGPYLVMEYLEGESVGTILGRMVRLSVESVVAIAIPVLEALDAAHRVGIIHRDLKPENVFIALGAERNVPVVRLLDFGIAKVLAATGSSPQTRTGIVFGTPDYLSPEQATGEVPLDGRSDLFAVGVLLYELLTGTRPFCAPTAVATAYRIVHSDAPTIASAGVLVDPRLEAMVRRLLQKEPDHRFATAGDVAAEMLPLASDPERRASALRRITNIGRRRVTIPSQEIEEDDTAPFPQPVREKTHAQSPEPPSQTPPHLRAPSGAAGEEHGAALPRNAGVDSVRRRAPEVAGCDLPMRFARRFQARGPVLRAVDGVLLDMYGAKARAEVVAQLPQRYQADFSNNTINSMVSYDLDAIHAYMELATVVAVHDLTTWREIGRRSVCGELHNSVRTLLRSGDLAGVVKRGIAVWSQLVSFGAWTFVSAPKVVVHVSAFEPASLPLRLWLVGVVEETTRQATGVEVTARTFLGELSFSPELAWELI